MQVRWRGFELPTRVVCEAATRTATYGKFIAEPFERGYGITVGNSLRRVLLSSLEGAAIASVRVDGVSNEFSTIEGVVEDVTDICLNLKQVRVKMHREEPVVLRIEKKGPGTVTAADISRDQNVEIVNPSQVIASLADDVTLRAELKVRKGRGFVMQDENVEPDAPVGTVFLDTVYSPVRRVRYRCEAARVGKRTNYDRLVLEVWTDGSIEPELALVEASTIVRKHFNPFVKYFELGRELEESGQGPALPEPAAGADRGALPVSELGLSSRIVNCLKAEGVETVGDLLKRTPKQLLEVRNFGPTSLDELEARLGELGLSLAAEAST